MHLALGVWMSVNVPVFVLSPSEHIVRMLVNIYIYNFFFLIGRNIVLILANMSVFIFFLYTNCVEVLYSEQINKYMLVICVFFFYFFLQIYLKKMYNIIHKEANF